MTLRTDHVAGAAFVGFGVLIIALSGDLPAGQLSMPGSGFLPMLIAGLTIVLGIALFLRARESEAFATVDWQDLTHAGPIILITAAAIAVYTWLGFIVTMVLLMLIVLIGIERRPVGIAAMYGVGVVVVTYGVFTYLLKAPLPTSPLGF
jgi:putative tricarboxylic transport membrane protein